MPGKTFSVSKSRNYRLYVGGESVSLIGTWMQRTAVSWIIYSLTRSTFMLELTYFATKFPTFLFSLFGGVVSDRYDRYRVLYHRSGFYGPGSYPGNACFYEELPIMGNPVVEHSPGNHQCH